MSDKASGSKSNTAVWVAIITGIFSLCTTVVTVLMGPVVAPVVQEMLRGTSPPVLATFAADTPAAAVILQTNTPIRPKKTATLAPPTKTPAPTNTPKGCAAVLSGIAEIDSPWLTNQVSLDGRMTFEQEWVDAVCLDIVLQGAWQPRTRWWIKNDDQWLYLLVNVPGNEINPQGVQISYFWPYPYTDKWERSDLGYISAEIYGWFSEGFDTLDLKEAKLLLEVLS